MELDKISNAKQELHEKGYCSFQLKDFDEGLYDFVYRNKPSDFETAKNVLTRVRIDIQPNAFKKDDIFDTSAFVKDFDTFDEAEKHIKYALNTYKKEDIFQVWYCGNSKPGISNETLFKPIFNKIARYFYDIKPLVDLHFNSQYTMYNKGCFLQNHKDGQTPGRICVVLIYLNENYDKDLKKYDEWIDKCHHLLKEATKAVNWFADEVRENINPMFFTEQGKFLISEGPFSDMSFRTSLLEFTELEKEAYLNPKIP